MSSLPGTCNSHPPCVELHDQDQLAGQEIRPSCFMVMDEPLLPAGTSSSPKHSKNHHISFHSFNRHATPLRPQRPDAFSFMSATSPTQTAHLPLNRPISNSPAITESHERTASVSRRSHSAPSIFSEIKEAASLGLNDKCPSTPSTPSVVKQAIVGVSLYVTIGVIVYMVRSSGFKGHTTFHLVDALYFTIVTLCTIGYGDIAPDTGFTKLFTCAFILVGLGFVDILLNGLVTYVLDKQEAVLLSSMDEDRRNMIFRTYVIDVKKGRMRVRMKVGLALGVVIGCIAMGTIVVHVLEGLSWLDSFYLSVTSVTTVGYGDYTFLTVEGRLFAAVWLLVSTLAVARAFLYLTELRIEKRNRRIARWVLGKKMTVGDLVAADLDNDGSIRVTNMQMGRTSFKDILHGRGRGSTNRGDRSMQKGSFSSASPSANMLILGGSTSACPTSHPTT